MGRRKTPSSHRSPRIPVQSNKDTNTDKKKKMMYFIKGTEPSDSNQNVFDSKVENVQPT